jgi:hypothetical protein
VDGNQCFHLYGPYKHKRFLHLDTGAPADQRKVCSVATSSYLYLIENRYMQINEIWDRIEKVLYLIIDAYLNYYFIRTVKINLVSNGLQKYNRLVRFNQGMIVVSLMMDMVILGAMSLPNGLV